MAKYSVKTDASERLQDVVTKNIRIRLALWGVTQATLADAMHMAQATLSLKLNRKTDWTLADIANAADFFREPSGNFVSTSTLDAIANDSDYQTQDASPSYSRESTGLVGSPRYLRKPDAADERGQANGPRMFMMPDLEVSGYMEKALRRSPQSRLGMGSPTWTRTKTKGSKDPCAAITPWGNGRNIRFLPSVHYAILFGRRIPRGVARRRCELFGES